MSVDRPVIYPQGAGQINQVQFWWKEPANTGGYPISFYTIQCPELPFSGSYPAGANTAVIPVPNGINYYFSITATNTNGITSAPADFAVISAGCTPDCISTIFVDVISSLYAEVTWETAFLPEQQAIHSYLVYAVPSTAYLSTLRFPVYAYQSSFNFIGYPSSYGFRVIAVGTGSLGTEKIISTPVVSMAGGARPIKNTTVTKNSPTEFTISWTGSQNATSFQFQIFPDDGSAPFFVTPTTLEGQTATFTGCDSWANYSSGPGYGIMIIATNSNGSSNSVINTIHFGPMPASSLTYSGVTPSSFTLRWLGANGASSFQFSLDCGSTIVNNAWSYGSDAIGSTLFTGFNNGSSFRGAVVYALNGTSTIITPSRGFSSFVLAPGPATNFAVSLVTQSSFSLTWGGAQGASDITYFGTEPTTTNGVNGPALYTGLNAGSYYSTILVPTNSSGSGVAAGTLIKTTPGAVTNIAQSVGSGNTLNITWTGSVGAENYGYVVGGAVSGPIYASTIQAAVVSGLTPNTTYSTAIIAYDVVFPTSGLVGSTLSNYVNLTTGSAAATNLVASNIGSDRFSVGWSGAVGATTLIFHYNSSFVSAAASGIANPYILTGLVQNTNYVVYIESVNAYGRTSSVSISQFTVVGIPALSTVNATSNGFTVFWSGVDTTSSMTFYFNNTSATVSQGSGPSYLVSGLLPNSTYTIYAVAQTPNSQRSSLTYSQLTAPTLPTNVALSGITATQISVSWTAGVTSSLTLRYGASSVLVTASPYTISGLVPNTAYSIYFEATNAVANYSTVAISQTTGPGPATGLSISNVQALQFNVGWSGAAGASSFTFFYNSSSITVGAVVSPYTLTGLAANTDYVVYINTTNSIANSSSLTVNQLTAPSVPTGLIVGSVTDTTMAISWTGGIASSFTFFYGPSAITVGGSVTSPYTISSLTANTSYLVYIVATNQTAAVSTLGVTQFTAPSATSGVNVTVINYSTVAIAWTTGQGASSFTFYYNTSSLTVSALETSPYYISSLIAGTDYTFYIDTVSESGLHTSSNSVSVLTVPAPAQVLAASSNTPSSFAVSWSGAQGASSLTFLYNTSSLTVSASESSPYSISSLSAGGSYSISVNATNATGTVSSNQLTAYTTATAPYNLAASNYSLSSFAISWSGPLGASSLTFVYNSASLTVPGTQTSPYTISSLAQSTTYVVYMNATTSGGLVTSSMNITATTYVAPAPATGLSASNNTGSSFAVAWLGAANASSLTFHYNTSTLTVAVSQTSPYTISSLVAGSSYTVYIDTVNIGALVSSQSIIAYTAALAANSLSASNFTLTSFAIGWSGAQGASSLTFVYNTSSLTVSASESSPYTISSLAQSTTYVVYINATTNAGLVTSSLYIEAATYISAFAPVGLTASNNTSNSFAISWSGAANASSLTFYYNTSSLTVPASQTSPYTISSLASGSSYTVYIDAVNIGSVASSLSITAYTAPALPANLNVNVISYSTLSVVWTGAQGASSLTFNYNTSSLTVAGNQTSPYLISSLNAGSTYTIYIDAIADSGLRTSSNSISVLTDPKPAQVLLASLNTPSSFAIGWSGAEGASSLTFLYNSSSITVGGNPANPYIISSLVAGSEYLVSIDATEGFGPAISSNQIVAYTKPVGPAGLASSGITASSVTLSWSGVVGASSLVFYYNSNSVGIVAQPSPYTLTSLTPGSTYSIYLDAVANSGLNTPSNTISVLMAPLAATSVATSNYNNTSFNITWSGAQGASSLTFYYGSNSVTVANQASPYTLTTVTAGSTYSVYIDASNATASVASGTTNGYTTAYAATGLSYSNPTATSFAVAWSGAAGASSLVFFYNGFSNTVPATQGSPLTITTSVGAGSTYTVFISSITSGGLVTTSNSITAYTAAYAATSLIYSNPTVTSFAVAWSGAAGASSLTFFYNGFSNTVAGNQASPLTITTSLGAGSTYTVFISSITSGGLVTTSNSITAYTSPYAATSLSYSNPTVTSFAVAWSGAQGASSLVFFYNGFSNTVAANQASPLTITTSVGAGSTYTVFISSITSGGLVATSNSVTAYTSPYAATSLSYSNPTATSFAVAWSGAQGASSLVFFYNGFSNTVNAASQASPLTITTSVGAGSTYTVLISSITSGGLVATSNSVTAYTSPYAATSLSYSNPTVTSFAVAWSGAAGASSLVFFYNGFSNTVPATQGSPLTITTSVGAGSTYTVFISSISNSGLIATSNSVTAYTSPYAATSLSYSNPTATSFAVAWSGAQGASSLVFFYNGFSNTVNAATQGSPLTITTSVGAGSTYTVLISSITSGGLVATSNSVTAYTSANAPTSLLVSNQSSSSFTIAWSGAAGASSLTFHYNSSNLTVPVSQTSPYTISSLTVNTTYTVYINATTSGGLFTSSVNVFASTIVNPPTALSNLTTTAVTFSTISISWTGGTGATSYTYLVNNVSTTAVIDNGVASQNATFNGLSPSSVYIFRIVAQNAGGSASLNPPAFSPTAASTFYWFDASDPAQLTVSAGKVTQWTNKGIGGNATTAQNVVIGTSINGLSTVQFVGQSFMNLPSRTATSFQASMFIAFQGNTMSGGAAGYFFTVNASNGPDFFWFNNTGNTPPNNIYLGTTIFSGEMNWIPSGGATINTCTTPTLLTSVLNGNSTTLPQGGWLNGTLLINSRNSGGTTSTSYTNNVLGNKLANSITYNMAEMVQFPAALDTVQRQQMEGYLAWKWGMRTSLPVTHPYYSIAPSPSAIITLVSPPTAATGLSATNVSASSFSVNWSGATNASSLVFFYNSASLTVPVSQTSPYTIGSLGAGSTYTVYINAVNVSGTASSQSIAVLTAPLAATSVATGSYSQTGFVITWSGAQGASSLTFRYNSNSVTVVNQGSPYTLSGLGAGSTYSVSIDAVNATATASSGSVNGFTTAFAPTGLTQSNQSTTAFAIAWSGAQGASSLTFNYNTLSVTVPASQASPYTITSLASASSTYTVFITATTSAGYTTNSASIFASTFVNPIFTPAASTGVPGLQLWFDASDPLGTGTAVSNGTAISTWYDKSGNGYNTTAVTGTIPYNSTTGGLTFDRSSNFKLPDGALPFGNSPFSIYVVARAINVNAYSYYLMGGGSPTDGGQVLIFLYNVNQNIYLQTGPQTQIGTYAEGQTFLFDGLYDSSSGNAYSVFNGTLGSTASFGSRSMPSGNNYIGCGLDAALDRTFHGTIYEILVYNVAHTAGQRQMVEGYLANKWNLKASLPTGHPYKSVGPSNALTPALSYVQPLYWFDASNSSALTLSGSSVTAFTNQGVAGNTKSASNVNVGTPINSLNTINFGSGGSRILALPTYNANSYLASMFVVFQGTSMASTNGGYFFFYGSLAGHGSPPDIVMYRNNAADIYIGVSILGGNEHQYQLVGPPINANDTTYTVPSLLSVVTNNSYQTLPQGTWVNGIQATNIKRGGGNTNTTYIDPFLGNQRTDGFSYNMAEYVHFPIALTTVQRQQVEGYLAWKWGTQSSLPPSHPFYTARPTTAAAAAAATTLPRSIGGLQLWFDAADPLATGTPPANGTTITTWFDKSGNGYNTIDGGNYAIYSAAGLVFTGNSQYYILPDGCLPYNDTSYSYFFVLRSPSTNAINPIMSGGNITGSRRCASFMCYNNGQIQTVWYNEGNYLAAAGYPANQTFLTCSLYSSGNQQIVGVNGTINSRTAGVTRIQPTTTNYIGISVDIANTFFNGTLCEILCYNSCLSTKQRQQVEGYLAWKWSIQSQLPGDHPYKNTAP